MSPLPNAQLSDRRQRRASALIFIGAGIALFGIVLALVRTSPIAWAICGIGAVPWGIGMFRASNLLVCPKCARRHLQIGRGGRTDCPFCGANYFESDGGRAALFKG
jgi:hypothetical protein